MLDCPVCGTRIPPGFRFCGSCGAPLTTDVPLGQGIRKVVSVLFCDVTGSTSLGERLDPETMRRLMSEYFEAVRAVLARHGGTVEKFVGDAVMAVFGIPVVHEDDALRACRAALEMRTVLEALNGRFRRDWDVEIAIRTGINTGGVVAGRGADDRAAASMTLVTGDPVNVAARLEQAAAPGEILIGAGTLELVHDAVVTEPTGPLEMRGKREPVPAFRLIGLAAAGRAPARAEPAMVGRGRELQILGQAFERVVSDGSCQLFTLLGSAGVGKSRLVREFLAGIGDRATVLRGRCLPYGDGITYWPIVEVIKQAAAIVDTDAPEAARAKLDDLFGVPPDGARVVDRLAQLMGLSDLPAPAEETLWAIRRALENLAAAGPVVVVLDDVHWAQGSFLDLVEHIADWSRDAPILLIVVSRADLLELRPGWGGGKLNATTILLEPLGGAECRSLLENLVGDAALPPEVAARIVEAAEGNPLFVEELFAMLLDEGALRRTEGRLVSTRALATLEVPPTIAALIAARLDRIHAPDRAALERAAVVGKAFWQAAVSELSPEAEREAIPGRLRELVRKDFVRRDRSSLPGDEAYRFRHILVRDAAYDGLAKADRADLHRRFARWLEGVAGDRLPEFEEIVGYHLEQAFRYSSELGPVDPVFRAAGTEAGERLGAAGRRALARGDLPGAISLLERAVELLPADASPRAGVLTDLGSALAEQGDYARASAVFSGAIQAAEQSGDEDAGSHAALTRLHVFYFTDPGGVAERTSREVERLIPVFEARGDELGLAKARRRLGLVHQTHGQYRAMAEQVRLAAEHARRAGDRREEGRSLVLAGVAAFLGPMPAAEAIELCDTILEASPGDPTIARGMAAMLAGLAAIQGRIDDADRFLERRMAICVDLGLRGEQAETIAQGGVIAALAEDHERARTELERACAAFRELGDRSGLAAAAAELARLRARLGEDRAALDAAAESEADAAPDDIRSQALWRGAAAVARARIGEDVLARRLAGEGVRLATMTESPAAQADALVAAADVDLALGDRPAAVTSLERARDRYAVKGHLVGLARVDARLAVLRLPD